MSTRGMIGLRVNGKFLGTYNHSDSYPDGLGADLTDFVRNLAKNGQTQTFKANAAKVKMVNSQSKPSEKVYAYYHGLTGGSMLGAERERKEFYSLLRGYQGVAGLDAILSGQLKHITKDPEFIKDSLFCEYAYILDLDREVLEYYEGFTKVKPSPDYEFGTECGGQGYYACRKVGEVPFAKATTKAMLKLFPKLD